MMQQRRMHHKGPQCFRKGLQRNLIHFGIVLSGSKEGSVKQGQCSNWLFIFIIENPEDYSWSRVAFCKGQQSSSEKLLINFVVAGQLEILLRFCLYPVENTVYILPRIFQSDRQQAIFISPLPITLFRIIKFIKYLTTLKIKVTIFFQLHSTFF